jgi:lipopolysaccharide biosynthesis regulator YciM
MGTLLLLFPVGFSMIGVIDVRQRGEVEPGDLWRKNYRPVKILAPFLLVVVLLVGNANKLASLWYSNLGAVQMSQTELRNFPANQWATVEMAPQLKMAEASLRSALVYDPENQTANYRLGMISLLRQDFRPAIISLEKAYQQAPEHRGIIKNLGYSYAWLGEIDKARFYLEGIPEAQSELEVYVWWWDTQGRQDLSANASRLASQIGKEADQP